MIVCKAVVWRCRLGSAVPIDIPVCLLLLTPEVENWVLRRMFGHIWACRKQTGSWRNLYNEQLRDPYFWRTEAALKTQACVGRYY
jgi:hypothetical protein